jgi:hypothetical protein
MLLIGQTATADVVRHATIPASLWGTWGFNLDDCNNADKIIVLSAKGRDSSEVKCTVDWVSETPGARVLMPTDASQVSVGPDFGSLKSYQRCPAITPAISR